MKPFYREILWESWDLTRRHFFLWPLALCASFAGITVAGSFQIFFEILSGNLSTESFLTGSDFITSTLVGWSVSFDQIPWSRLTVNDIPYVLAFFVLMFIVLGLALVFVSSEGALIHAFYQLQDKRRAEYLSSFRKGLDKFWQLFGIYIVYRLFTIIVIALLIAPFISFAVTASAGGRFISLMLVYLILIPAVVILNLVTRYSLLYIMIHGNTIREAFSNAWLLFRTNWLISLETSLLIIVGMLILFTVFTLVLIPILVILLTLFGSIVSFSPIAFQLFTLVGLSLLLVIVAVFVMIFTAIQMSIWVGVFKRISSSEHRSKIHRLTHHVAWLHRKVI